MSNIHILSYLPLGDVMVIQNRTIQPKDVMTTLIVKSQCKCRMACWTHTKCKALSVVHSDDSQSLQCLLSSKNHAELQLDIQDNALYMERLSADYWQESDGTHYLVPSSILLGHEAAVRFCSRIPGYRLGIFKSTSEAHVLNRIYEKEKQNSDDNKRELRVNMKYESTVPLWEDGTSLKDSDIFSTYKCYVHNADNICFVLDRSLGGDATVLFRARGCERKSRFVCQSYID
ncbi:unnamed protein product [Meganyctiphanes norvegica]|uniref:Apple domain-containing protein n=1 Tax=Meganyctiphanes norvegica TaxID=48144 RepID=A0AAV2QEN1_MEGNR